MRCSFVHFGDVHLGTQQYDSPERLNDFGRAWLFACEYIAKRRPDFAICTGDLFNRFSINPITFDQAYAGLAILRDAGVPIVDVQGNHDRARYGEAKTWIHTLAEQGLLIHLDVASNAATGPRLEPVSPQRRTGSYVEWAGCRVIGARYLGASTERFLESVEAEIDRFGHDAFTILVLHAGLEGIVPHLSAELSAAAVERLRGRIDYVALGHIHKHYAVGSLVYNGGSLETWASNEWGWRRGLLDVQIDTSQTPAVTFDLVDVPRRPFSIIRLDVDRFADPRSLLRECYDQLQAARARLAGERPVAIVTLRGRLRFDATAVPANDLETMARQILDPVVLQVREEFEGRDFVNEGETDSDQPLDRDVLERSILQARFAQDERYARSAGAMAAIASELKERALRDESTAEIVAAFRAFGPPTVDPVAEGDDLVPALSSRGFTQ